MLIEGELMLIRKAAPTFASVADAEYVSLCESQWRTACKRRGFSRAPLQALATVPVESALDICSQSTMPANPKNSKHPSRPSAGVAFQSVAIALRRFEP